MSNKEPTEAQGCFTFFGLIAFIICFILAEQQWIADQWKTWGCLIKVCLSPFIVIAIGWVVTIPFRN